MEELNTPTMPTDVVPNYLSFVPIQITLDINPGDLLSSAVKAVS